MPAMHEFPSYLQKNWTWPLPRKLLSTCSSCVLLVCRKPLHQFIRSSSPPKQPQRCQQVHVSSCVLLFFAFPSKSSDLLPKLKIGYATWSWWVLWHQLEKHRRFFLQESCWSIEFSHPTCIGLGILSSSTNFNVTGIHSDHVTYQQEKKHNRNLVYTLFILFKTSFLWSWCLGLCRKSLFREGAQLMMIWEFKILNKKGKPRWTLAQNLPRI